MKQRPNIPARLLWEYDYDTFNFDKSYKIVIERVMQRGNLAEWKTILQYYSKEQLLSALEWSAQLDKQDKAFALFFMNSDLINAA
ncbi:MAG: hypothetical protein RL065_1410 [Bacteroidota bacterium]